MDFQLIIVALIVAAALFYAGRRAWNKSKALSKKSSCGAGCGCGK